MRLRWITAVLLLGLLATCSVDAQKRRKGEKKKEPETMTAAQVPEARGGRHRGGRHTSTTTTTTTTPSTTTVALPEEEIEEEVQITNEFRTAINVCPPELKPQEGKVLPCTCRDELDDNTLMVECVALTSGQQMHKIFNTLLLGKRIDGLEVRNSTLGPLVARQTAQAYVGNMLMRGNQITELVPDTFQGTDQIVGRLDLSSNQLSKVNFPMFDSFTQLQVLNLGENLLTNIEDAGQAPSLRVLYLYSNRIDTIAPNAFRKLGGLEYLDLRWNNLQVLAPGALHVTSDRWQLRLRANQLSSLEQAFAEDNMPYLVDLSLNNIGSLTDRVYGPLIDSAILEGSKFYVAGNPIICDCSLSWLVKNARLLSIVVGARCDGDGTPIADLNLDDFRKCPAPRPWKSPLDKALAELAKDIDSQ